MRRAIASAPDGASRRLVCQRHRGAHRLSLVCKAGSLAAHCRYPQEWGDHVAPRCAPPPPAIGHRAALQQLKMESLWSAAPLLSSNRQPGREAGGSPKTLNLGSTCSERSAKSRPFPSPAIQIYTVRPPNPQPKPSPTLSQKFQVSQSDRACSLRVRASCSATHAVSGQKLAVHRTQ